jgi:hypothetical protein
MPVVVLGSAVAVSPVELMLYIVSDCTISEAGLQHTL